MAAKKTLDDAQRKLGEVITELENLRDSLQSEFDEKTEQWQEGERGQAMEQRIEDLETVCDGLNDQQTAIGEIIGNLGN